MVPWASDPTVQIIHDCFTRDGAPHELAPRNVLRRVIERYEALGLKPIIAPELEFFLVQKNTDPDFPLQPPVGRNGRPETARQSYSIDAVNEFDPILDLMYDYCESMELDVDTLIHESGAAQLEINFRHADPLSRADQVFLFKRTVREAALRHDIYATFLAKPMENEPGSSMHIHQSIARCQNRQERVHRQGRRATQRAVHELPGWPAALHSGGDGVLRAERQLLPSPGLWRGLAEERAMGLRQPHLRPARAVRQPGKHARGEPFRRLRRQSLPGHRCHTGLRICWASSRSCSPPNPRPVSRIPAASNCPSRCRIRWSSSSAPTALGGILGERFCKAYICIKRKEYETFFRVISSWEREFLLLNV